MKKNFITIPSLFFLLLLTSWTQQPKKENPYHLEIVSNMADYQKTILSDPTIRLVDLEKAMNGIVLDIRYATSNNFTHQTILRVWGYTAQRLNINSPGLSDEGALPRVNEGRKVTVRGRILKIEISPFRTEGTQG